MLGSLAEVELHQDFTRDTHLIKKAEFFIILEVIYKIQVRFSGNFLSVQFSYALPITIFIEKTIGRSRKIHQTNLHWESANLAI